MTFDRLGADELVTDLGESAERLGLVLDGHVYVSFSCSRGAPVVVRWIV